MRILIESGILLNCLYFDQMHEWTERLQLDDSAMEFIKLIGSEHCILVLFIASDHQRTLENRD